MPSAGTVEVVFFTSNLLSFLSEQFKIFILKLQCCPSNLFGCERCKFFTSHLLSFLSDQFKIFILELEWSPIGNRNF